MTTTRPAAPPILGQRALNRALLARQHLLERTDMSAADMIEGLVGMQSQAPLAPYVGLWTRINRFEPAELAGLMTERAAVRASLMRYTLHLVTARDYLALRPVFAPLLAQRFRGSAFRRNLVDVDLDELARLARALIEERPRTALELGRRLAERWPGRDVLSLSAAAGPLLALVQVPPRGVWGVGGLPTWGLAETWLGAKVGADPAPDGLVLRYLRAFGPATIADIGNWSGLTRLGTVVERLRDRLVVFRDERDRELFDLLDAPRPDPDVQAPARFLPEYDNLLLGHKDRTRVMDVDQATPLFPGNGAALGSVLLDGRFGGGWRIERRGPAAILRIDLVAAPSGQERRELIDEGGRLLAFVAGANGPRDVVIATAH
ncbi:MAG: winged helix DNA-binding domain-containing protein [Candidatus Limnocylindrales bacterium]